MKKAFRLQIGLRTIKTAAAVIISMLIVDYFGATSSKLIFAMLGAMAAVQPSFKASVESCLTQIVGVLFGAVVGVILLALRLPSLVATGIGLILVITLYNSLGIKFSNGIPCFIVVMICTTPDIQPMTYAVGRIWDTAIGLTVGMVINMLIFPYDNSRKIRAVAEGLDSELIAFLEDFFDGDENLPDVQSMAKQIDEMAIQLRLFSNQRLILHLKRQSQQLESFRICEGKARELIARMEVLSRMEKPGRLDEANRESLIAAGAHIAEDQLVSERTELDIVMNYHIRQVLKIRAELLDALGKI